MQAKSSEPLGYTGDLYRGHARSFTLVNLRGGPSLIAVEITLKYNMMQQGILAGHTRTRMYTFQKHCNVELICMSQLLYSKYGH